MDLVLPESPMEDLYPELRMEIWSIMLEWRDWQTLELACRVCSRWRNEIEYLWRNFCIKTNLLADELDWKLKGKDWKWLCKCRSTLILKDKDTEAALMVFGNCAGTVTGTFYEGEWKNNQRNGVGCFTWQNKDRYIGEWLEDCKHGHGLMLWVNGDRYDGFWKTDLRHGTATYKYDNGGKYVGQYEHDERHGTGKFFWPDGDFYEGTWRSGGRSGPGILFYQSQKISQNWNESSTANYSQKLPPKFQSENEVMRSL